jgi:PAS domain-containing protein
MSSLFDGMHLAVALVGLDMRFLDCNDSILALLGYARAELTGSAITLVDCFHPASQAELRSILAQLLSNAQSPLEEVAWTWLCSTAKYTIRRQDECCIAAACRISVVVGPRPKCEPICFSLLVDGKQEFRT